MFPLTESFLDLMKLLLVLSGVFGVWIIVNALTLLVKVRGTPRRHLLKKRNIGAAFVGLPLFILGLRLAWRLLPSLSDLTQRVGIGTFIVLLFSVLLFGVKIVALHRYAIVELLFGIVVCGTTLYSLDNSESPLKLVGIGTAVYLIVRGLDNFLKGMEERESEAAADAVTKRVRAPGP